MEKETGSVGYTKTIKDFESIVRFGLDRNTGPNDVVLRGGKGNKLFLMSLDGLNVPAGWTITSDMTATSGHATNSTVMKELSIRNRRELISLARQVGYIPLVSVRSGAAESMPGMMDTILNVGMSDDSLPFWIERIGETAARDCYRRLVVMFGEVVHGIEYGDDSKNLDLALEQYLCSTGEHFPQDMMEQIDLSVAAVFKSWNGERAKLYRAAKNIPDSMGTAVNIQMMVFGNRGDDSGAGVLFSRDVCTGENTIMAEFLIDAQGEDVVAAASTPMPFSEMPEHGAGWGGIAAELGSIAHLLEEKYNDVQDIEFTVEAGELFILQTRDAKRTGLASLVIARDFVKEDRLTRAQALDRVSPMDFAHANLPQVDPKFKAAPMFKGIAACPGVVTGKIVTSAADAVKAKGPVILVTKDTDVNDLAGMQAAAGVLTSIGGRTSHAAVVARDLNKPTVVGAGFELSSCPDGLEITIDGLTGNVWAGKVPTIDGSGHEAVEELVEWAFEKSGCQRSDVKVDRDKMTVPVTSWLADKKAEKAGLKAIKAMTDRSGIVIEIATEKSFRRDEDEILWNVFGDSEHDETAVVGLIDRFVDAKLEGAIVKLDGWELQKHADRLKAAGYVMVKRVDTLEDLIMSEGPIEWVSATNTIGGEVWHKVTEMKKLAGEPISMLPASMSVVEAVSKAFKGE
jgi:phosphoenolpyruvate synthase/pyruvate phosphate dikinase